MIDNITLKRNDDFGRLYVNDQFVCFTLDPRVLPVGKYTVKVCYSPRFKCELPLIYNSIYTASRGFRIHSGNTLVDSNGCILVGEEVHVDHSGVTLRNSKKALDRLMKLLTGDEICLSIL